MRSPRWRTDSGSSSSPRSTSGRPRSAPRSSCTGRQGRSSRGADGAPTCDAPATGIRPQRRALRRGPRLISPPRQSESAAIDRNGGGKPAGSASDVPDPSAPGDGSGRGTPNRAAPRAVEVEPQPGQAAEQRRQCDRSDLVTGHPHAEAEVVPDAEREVPRLRPADVERRPDARSDARRGSPPPTLIPRRAPGSRRVAPSVTGATT